MNRVRKFFRDERGATAIEYALLGALIALVIITGLNNIGTNLKAQFTTIATKLL